MPFLDCDGPQFLQHDPPKMRDDLLCSQLAIAFYGLGRKSMRWSLKPLAQVLGYPRLRGLWERVGIGGAQQLGKLASRGSVDGHGNIATTSGYLHARPESSSGLKLDPGVFLR